MIELLAAICIIAILGVLTAGALNKQIARSQASTCAGRLKQTGAGIVAYTADNQGRLPGPFTSQSFQPGYKEFPNPAGDGESGLYYFIWPYVGLKNVGSTKSVAKIGVCPAADNKSRSWLLNSKFFTTQVHNDSTGDEDITYVNYPVFRELPSTAPFLANYPFGAGANNKVENGDSPPTQPWIINGITRPSQLALLSELPGNLRGSKFRDNNFPIDYHAHCNILFLDGHVEMRSKHQKVDADHAKTL